MKRNLITEPSNIKFVSTKVQLQLRYKKLRPWFEKLVPLEGYITCPKRFASVFNGVAAEIGEMVMDCNECEESDLNPGQMFYFGITAHDVAGEKNIDNPEFDFTFNYDGTANILLSVYNEEFEFLAQYYSKKLKLKFKPGAIPLTYYLPENENVSWRSAFLLLGGILKARAQIFTLI